MEKTIRDERVVARDAAAAFQNAFENVTLPQGSVPFPDTYFGMDFQAVAKSIKVAQSPVTPLRQDRQVYVVSSYGWDHHSTMMNAMDDQILEIDRALKAFYDFLVAESLLNRVTVFVITEFGRTWTFNGDGTDHAWGGNVFVMGGAVNATPGNNRIWGTYPSFAASSTGPSGIDQGRGSIIPQTATDLYHAELCRWFGIGNDGNLVTVLPNIRRFYGAGATSHPVGFLNY